MRSQNVLYKKPTFKDKFINLWNKFLSLVKKVSMLITLFLIISTLISMVYFLFIDYDPIRTVVSGMVLCVAVYTNLKL